MSLHLFSLPPLISPAGLNLKNVAGPALLASRHLKELIKRYRQGKGLSKELEGDRIQEKHRVDFSARAVIAGDYRTKSIWKHLRKRAKHVIHSRLIVCDVGEFSLQLLWVPLDAGLADNTDEELSDAPEHDEFQRQLRLVHLFHRVQTVFLFHQMPEFCETVHNYYSPGSRRSRASIIVDRATMLMNAVRAQQPTTGVVGAGSWRKAIPPDGLISKIDAMPVDAFRKGQNPLPWISAYLFADPSDALQADTRLLLSQCYLEAPLDSSRSRRLFNLNGNVGSPPETCLEVLEWIGTHHQRVLQLSTDKNLEAGVLMRCDMYEMACKSFVGNFDVLNLILRDVRHSIIEPLL